MFWRIEAQHLLLPKDGAEMSECEDAIGINEMAWRYAVADGATESFDAQHWAQQLADGWVKSTSPLLSIEAFRSWVAAQGQERQSYWSQRPLPWYAEEKARHGSFAAFVGVQFSLQEDQLQWQALALGDSCLVCRRGERLCGVIPISDAEGFNSMPVLVPSLVIMQDEVLSHTIVETGVVADGDVFWLFSDALAAWYLKSFAARDPVIAEFESLVASSREQEVSQLLREERLARKLKDDDLAMVRIAPARVA